MFNRISIVGLVIGISGSVHANMWTVSANLFGLSEVPPNASPAIGTLTGTYNDVTKNLTVDTFASGMLAPVTAAHIHTGAVGVSGPVLFPLSGVVGGLTFTSHDVFVLTAGQEINLLGGLNYVNVHSTAFPGGEIRGQLVATPVPEPAAFAVLGLGALALIRRRKVK